MQKDGIALAVRVRILFRGIHECGISIRDIHQDAHPVDAHQRQERHGRILDGRPAVHPSLGDDAIERGRQSGIANLDVEVFDFRLDDFDFALGNRFVDVGSLEFNALGHGLCLGGFPRGLGRLPDTQLLLRNFRRLGVAFDQHSSPRVFVGPGVVLGLELATRCFDSSTS